MAIEEKRSPKVVLTCKGKDCGAKQYPHHSMPVPCHCVKCNVKVPPEIVPEYVGSVEGLMDALQGEGDYRGQVAAANRLSGNPACPFTIQVI